MGRRSINTTKSGKYMNPTDQARKEARKKELKKNKRQRQIVRTAVLRGKDPMQLLAEMEKIDQMEYNVLQPSPLNEKVLKDKRKKLRDTFDRVMKMYYKDDLEKWKEIRRSEGDYEKRRANLLAYYEAVRFTQQVSVDEIPLPMTQMNVDSILGMGAIPMPNEYGMMPLPTFNATLPPPPGILRKKSMYSPPPSPSKVSKLNKIPPGLPPGPPPELSGEEDEGFEDNSSDSDSDKESRKKQRKAKGRAIRFAESDSSDSEKEEVKKKSKTYSTGHDIDQFMKEMEEVHKKKEAQRDKDTDKESDGNLAAVSAPSGQMPSGLPPAPPLGVPPHLMYRPPPMMMAPGGIRLPPGPPPGPPPGMPPRSSGIRLPPGPPPGIPPSMMRYSASSAMTPGNLNVVSAAPQLIRENDIQPPGEEQPKSSATIEAKAKIRNLNADITRFMPMSVRIKRDDGKPKPKPEKRLAAPIDVPKPKPIPNSAPNATQPSKDDAYMQFMREMKGLL